MTSASILCVVVRARGVGVFECVCVCECVMKGRGHSGESVCVRVLYILHYSGAHLPLLFLPCLVSTLRGGLFCRLDVFSAGAALIFELREKSSFTPLSRKTHTHTHTEFNTE